MKKQTAPWTVEALDPFSLLRYVKLVRDPIRHLTGSPGTELPLAVGASAGQEPVGLGLAESGLQARVLTITVKPGHSSRELGTAILEELDCMLARRGHATAEMEFRRDRPFLKDIDAVLSDRGWSPPRLHRLYCASGARAALAQRWAHVGTLSENCTVLPWDELDAGVLNSLEAWDEEGIQIPPHIDPRKMAEGVCPDASVALLREDRLAGWFLTHFQPPRHFVGCISYVHPALQPRGYWAVILRTSLQAMIRMAGPDAMVGWVVYPDREPSMARLTIRRIRPIASHMSEWMRSSRRYDCASEGVARRSKEGLPPPVSPRTRS